MPNDYYGDIDPRVIESLTRMQQNSQAGELDRNKRLATLLRSMQNPGLIDAGRYKIQSGLGGVLQQLAGAMGGAYLDSQSRGTEAAMDVQGAKDSRDAYELLRRKRQAQVPVNYDMPTGYGTEY